MALDCFRGNELVYLAPALKASDDRLDRVVAAVPADDVRRPGIQKFPGQAAHRRRPWPRDREDALCPAGTEDTDHDRKLGPRIREVDQRRAGRMASRIAYRHDACMTEGTLKLRQIRLS